MDSENNIKILHFLPRWDNGGMEHAALDIVTHFEGTCTYEICTAFLDSEFAVDDLKKRGIKFTTLYQNREYSFKDCVKGLHNYLKENKYDIVHCHVNNAIGLIFAAVSKRAGVKRVVIHTHNNSFGAGTEKAAEDYINRGVWEHTRSLFGVFRGSGKVDVWYRYRKKGKLSCDL